MSSVAFVGYSYGVDPRLIGGHQSILRRLAHHLVSRGHTVDFLIYGEPEVTTQAFGPGQTIRTFPTFGSMTNRLESEQYDYTQLSYLPFGTYPAAIRYLAHRRRSSGSRLGYLYVVWPARASMRLARAVLFKLFYDQVFAVSPRLKRNLEAYRVPSTLMLPPVPDEYFAPVLRVSDRPRVAYIGRVDGDKGTQHVVELMKRLKATCSNVDMEIVGYYYPHSDASMALHKALEAQSAIRYEGGSYTGYDSSAETRLLGRLRSTDLLVLPYEYLSGITVDTPLLLLEAMAAGCCVLTTHVGDLAEVVSQPALVTESVNDMSEIAERLIASGETRLFGDAMRNRALELGVQLSTIGDRYIREVGLA